MKGAERPIGVFDSGIGGLTVFSALSRRMPGENLIYFGDTEHLPYGNKSRRTVTRYSLAVARFLRAKRIKALVVACNTASALALSEIRRALDVPVLGVIEPGARAAARASRSGRVGIIGTEATIGSQAYSRALRALLPRARIAATPCPLFVPLVEEGWWRHPVTESVARSYLKPIARARVDALILGCTHYPLLKTVIRRVLGPRVTLIDSAEEVSRQTQELLLKLGLARGSGRGAWRFYVSDGPERFDRLARRLLGIPASGVSVKKLQ